jgi:hypothetical protein
LLEMPFNPPWYLKQSTRDFIAGREIA